jgi:hypothetical protein
MLPLIRLPCFMMFYFPKPFLSTSACSLTLFFSSQSFSLYSITLLFMFFPTYCGILIISFIFQFTIIYMIFILYISIHLILMLCCSIIAIFCIYKYTHPINSLTILWISLGYSFNFSTLTSTSLIPFNFNLTSWWFDGLNIIIF